MTAIELAVKQINDIIRPLSAEDRAEVLAHFTVAGMGERERIEKTLEAVGGNVTRAAAVLGCSRRLLQRHMRRLGMEPHPRGRKPKLIGL